LDSTGTVENSI